mgnify:CR=1 FL=1
MVSDPAAKHHSTRQGLLAIDKFEDSFALVCRESCEVLRERAFADCCFDAVNLALSATADALRVTNARNNSSHLT